MKILLDTHIFLWAITDDSRLTRRQQQIFSDEHNDLFLSVASVWEIVIKVAVGKLPLPQPSVAYVERHLKKNQIKLLPLRLPHLSALESVPLLHRDPFDRILVAQAQVEGMPILSVDPLISQYGLKVLPENSG